MSAIPALARIDTAAATLAPLSPQLARALRHDAIDLAELFDAARSRRDIRADAACVDAAVQDRLAAAVDALSPANADTLMPSSVELRVIAPGAPPQENALAAIRERITAEIVAALGAAASCTPLKVLADASRIPATDPRTDHVAVLWPDGTMIHPVSLCTLKGSPFANWDDADAACRALRVLGFADWRLAPLETWERYVIDRTRFAPALDTNLYPRIETSDWHWTATDLAGGSKDAAGLSRSAWLVYASYGLVYYSPRSYSGFALAVRRVGQ